MKNRLPTFSALLLGFALLSGCAAIKGSSHPPGEDAGAVDQTLDGAEGADPLAAEIDLSNEAAEEAEDEPFATRGVEVEEDEESLSGF